MDGALGLLRIRVKRGINLAVRDTRSCDPYVLISCDSQKLKTKVVKNTSNPVWNDEMTMYVKDPNAHIVLSVFDKDTFTRDDKMGTAQIDVKPLMKCLKMGLQLQTLPDGTVVDRVQPTKENYLADESCVTWSKGKMTQDMLLRLKDVECGELELQIEWIDLPGNERPQH